MKKRDQGVLTIEASIVLSILVLLILFLFSFARVYRAQSVVSHAAIQTADAVALESYLRENAMEADAQNILFLVNKLTGATTITADGLESFRSANLPKVAKQRFITAVAGSESVADKKLRSVGVKDGLSGIDFSGCEIILGSDDVVISLSYTIEMQFPVLGMREIKVTKAAKAKTFGDILFAVTTSPNNKSWGETGGDCKVVLGTKTEIWAKPYYGYKFVKWSDGSTENPRTIEVIGAAHYEAIFEPDQFGVNVFMDNVDDQQEKTHASGDNKGETYFGKVQGFGQHPYLSNVTITAEPKQHYRFVGWDDNGDGKVDNTSSSRTVLVDKTKSYCALYEAVEYTITVKTNDSKLGLVMDPADGQGKNSFQIRAKYGTWIQLTASVKSTTAATFEGWQHSNGSFVGQSMVQVTGNAVYTAKFKANTYTVNFYSGSTKVHSTKVIRGSSIDGSQMYISSSMYDGHRLNGFSHWRKADGSVFTVETKVNSDLNVYAVLKFTITFDANGGKIDGLSSTTYSANGGEYFDFSSYIPVRDGFTFDGWYSGGIKYSGSQRITSDISVTASWTCKHRYNNGASMYVPIQTFKGDAQCSNSRTIHRCSGCGHEKTTVGVGECHYDAWCGTKHPLETNKHWWKCGSNGKYKYHYWGAFGCVTCKHCGRLQNAKYWDKYETWRSGGSLWCVDHNGHTGLASGIAYDEQHGPPR